MCFNQIKPEPVQKVKKLVVVETLDAHIAPAWVHRQHCEAILCTTTDNGTIIRKWFWDCPKALIAKHMNIKMREHRGVVGYENGGKLEDFRVAAIAELCANPQHQIDFPRGHISPYSWRQ
tara:strand:+ start:95 stop:454 length:360 start_codon:yes stop_codon:yes gene_type:complete